MWIQRRKPSPSRAGRDGVVEVAGARRVDGEGRLGGQVAARAGVGARAARSRARASSSWRSRKVGRRPRSATSAATTSRALSARPRSTIGWRAAAVDPAERDAAVVDPDAARARG